LGQFVQGEIGVQALGSRWQAGKEFVYEFLNDGGLGSGRVDSVALGAGRIRGVHEVHRS
jgi:hypothetical protein